MDNKFTYNDFKKKVRPYSIVSNALVYLSVAVIIGLLVGIIGYVLFNGLPAVNWNFLSTEPSFLENTYGVLPMIINTLYVVVISLIISLPIGIGAAIYLSEYAAQNRLVNLFRSAIEILAGIPSVVYGLFGLVLFVTLLNCGYSILAGCFTVAVIVLPTLIRTTEVSLKAVDLNYREGAMSLGVSKFHIIRTILLPCAMPGIVTAIILSIGRIVGESAALLYTSSTAYDMPTNLFGHVMQSGATLTVQLYIYATEGSAPSNIPFAIASVLLVLVFVLNVIATLLEKALKK